MTRPAARRTAKIAAGILTLGLTAGLGFQTPAAAATNDTAIGGRVVISQVYGGGGNVGGVLAHDFVELFNRSTQPIDVSGWSVQYAAATGTQNLGQTVATRTALGNGTVIPAGGHLLIRGASGDQAGQPALPTADVTSETPIQLHESSGKVALVKQSASLGCNTAASCSPAQLALVEDLVGYGNANWAETSPTATLSPRTASVRAGAGCTDTDRNGADLAAAAPAPRTSKTPVAPCAVATAPAPVVAQPAPAADPAPVADGATPLAAEPATTDESLAVVGDPADPVAVADVLEVTSAVVAAYESQLEVIVAELGTTTASDEVGQLVNEIAAVAELTEAKQDELEAKTEAVTETASAPAVDAAPVVQPAPVVTAPAKAAAPHPGCNGIVVANAKPASAKTKTVIATLHTAWGCGTETAQPNGR